MILKEKYQQEDLREFKIEDSRFNIKFGYRPNGEFRIKVARKHEYVLDHTSDGFWTNKRKGYKFGGVPDDYKVLVTDDTPILNCLSNRTLNLLNNNYEKLGLKKIDSEFKLSDLKHLDFNDLMRCRGAWKRSRDEIKNMLTSVGLI